ncbi:DNA translocase FtsK 4TM domain-containing protein [Belnapia sp. T18]|uniref:DNA translocase FtsK n=1 Tax=Belnapia arida TaxID=2804533 RepID=A0ABS1U2R3_9PROT|nr:DNA translocase FtsK 4TM domain-containing protein [Belnapia arida]MBL6078951.1 DNA translocase FtsK 4TM domain-containing protein [Belnapia arida]
MPAPRISAADRPAPSARLRRFASPAVKAAMRRRLFELLALVAALAGLGLLVALASYDPADPSLSTATTRVPTNLAGPAGATVSDLLMQGFGWAGALPGLALLGWAWRLGSHRGLGLFPARLAALLAAMPLLAALLTLAPFPAGIPVESGAGGAAGAMVHGAVTHHAAALFGPFGGVIGDVALVALALALSAAALGLSPGEWVGLGRAARTGAGGVARFGAAGLSRAGGAGARQARSLLGRIGGGIVSLFRFRRRRPAVSPPDDLARVLRAADAAAEAPRAPRREPRLAEDRAEPMAGPPPVVSKPPKVAAPPAPPKRNEAVRQPQLDLQDSPWRLPPLSLLQEPPAKRTGRPSEEALQANARLLEQVLEDYGVRGRIAAINPGPVVTLYELEPAPGTKSARVIGLADDIARNMHVTAVRIATVPGRNVIGIELPNAKRETVYFSESMAAEEWVRHPGRLPLALGKDIGGNPVIADLARMPHLLIAGTTGSGKSVAINTMILSLLWRFSPEECRFIMIDPKMLELSVYDRIPHLLAPVVTEPPKAIGALKWTVREMEKRYRAMSQLGVRNIGGYNEKVVEARRRGEVLTRKVQTGFDPETGKPVFDEQPLALAPLPMIVVVIDEMADLMIVAGKEIEAAVQRLAQMARAAGIHVIMATQRPSVDVITGTIKANFPTRISFQVTSKIDSRTILGEQGAEQLLGQGDMLHMAGGGRVARVHGPFVSDTEVEKVVEFLREQGEPAYIEEVTESEEELEGGEGLSLSGIAAGSDSEKGLFDQAVALVSREGKASTSFIQRHLNIGYNRAAKLIEQMEKEGVVGPANHVGKREVLTRRTEED